MTVLAHRPFSLHIYLPNGTPEGIRILDKSMWTGRGVYVPRALFSDAKQRPEFSQTGVYVLVGPPDQGELPKIYVGQAEVVGQRLQAHHVSKDFWTWAVFFVSKDDSLNRAHAQYLETRLIGLAQQAKRASIENLNAPTLPRLPEWEEADMKGFLADMLSILPLVGLRVFEQPSHPVTRQHMLFLKAKGVEARGYEAPDGFVVFKDSQAVTREVPSILTYQSSLRADLLNQGVVEPRDEKWLFAQDYVFSSPSTAAAVILGRNANGRIEWKDEKGRTLRGIQESTASQAVQP